MVGRVGVVVGAVLGAVALAFAPAPVEAGTGHGHHPPGPAYDHYVALGDSYTAAPLVPQVDVAGGCFRSTSNYPALIIRSGQVASGVDRSCSGAQTKDMTGVQQTALGPVAPQLDSITGDTDLVTLSVGGNDEAVFGTLVTFCPTLRPTHPTGDPCRKAMNATGSDRLLDAVDRTQAKLEAVLEEIRARAPHARILVPGYPQLAPKHGTCPALLPLADGDYSYALTVNRALNSALRKAARREHAEYVDVWRASRGHDICSADPWVNGQFTDPARAQNFHPFANEQAAVADLVLDAISHPGRQDDHGHHGDRHARR